MKRARRGEPWAALAVRAALLLGAIGGGACGGAHLMGGRFSDQHVSYAVGDPGPGWELVRLPTANVAWFQRDLRASLLVNSHCEGVGDATLVALTGDLLLGMSDREILQQERKPWSRREALETVATARLDGVQRKLSIFVLKKDTCVYDIVLDAAPESWTAAQPGFVRVRDGFAVGARRDRG